MADSYTGNVSVGGAADTRTLPGLTVRKLAVGEYDNNCYFLRCAGSDEVLLVDAANEPDRLLAELQQVGGRLTTIVTTHRHFDHWQALERVQQETGARVLAHPEDAGELPVPVDETIDDGGEVRVGDCRLSVIHLVGHTPGSVALLYDADGEIAETPHLFTGDSLFPGGPGRTTDPKDFTSLMDDLERKVFGPLPDATWFYPGHGNDSTLGAERPHLGEWRERGW